MKEITLEAKDAAEGIKQHETDDVEFRICVTGQLNQRIFADITKAICEKSHSVVLDLSGTTGLTSFKIGKSEEELEYCSPVRELVLPASIEDIDTLSFYKFPNLEALSVVPESKFFAAVDGVLYTKDMTTLFSYPANKFVRGSFIVPDGVTTIKEYAFYDCKGYFDNIVFPKTLRIIERNAFKDSLFRELILPEGVTHIYDTLVNTHFARITLPKSLKKLDVDFLKNVRVMPDITYTGTKAEWWSLFFSYLVANNPISFDNRIYDSGVFKETCIHCSDGDFVIEEKYEMSVNELTVDGKEVNNILSSLKRGLWRIHVTGTCTNNILEDLITVFDNSELNRNEYGLILDLSAVKELIQIHLVTGDLGYNYCIREVIIPDSVSEIKISYCCMLSGYSHSPIKYSVGAGNEHFVVIDDTLYTKDMSELVICFSKKRNFKVPDGVTKIRAGAFTSCYFYDLSLPGSINELYFESFDLDGIHGFDEDENASDEYDFEDNKVYVHPFIRNIHFAGTCDKFLKLIPEEDKSYFGRIKIHCSDGDLKTE